MPVSFTTTREESDAIARIVKRYAKLKGWRVGDSALNLTMDVKACHANGCPLDFARLEAFDDFNLAHDLAGISRHISRTTGELGGFFSPKCSLPEKAKA